MKTEKGCKTCAHRDDESVGGVGRCIGCANSRCLSKWKAGKSTAWRLAVLAVGLAILGQTGCVSTWKYNRSEDQIRAIRAVQLKDGGVGAGLDVTAINVFLHDPLGQTAAAIPDILMGIGAYKFGEANNLWGKKSSKENAPPPAVGHDYNTVSVTGNGNTTQVIMYPVSYGAE